MKQDTKIKIITSAKKYFNTNGFSAMSLFELAQKIGMTRGNLAYHFKDKDALLKAIADEMWSTIEVERAKSRQFPSFENLHNEVQLLYRIQKEYAFIFLDTHVLNHPSIRKQFRAMTQQSINDNKAAIAFSIKSGNMNPESIAGMYHHLAFITWMLSFYWLSQQIIRGEKTKEDGEKMVWSIMIPHFTSKGIHAFKTFFGQDYYDNLGPAFDVDASAFHTF